MADEEEKIQDSDYKNVLVGVTGSVATKKLGKLIQELLASEIKQQVQVVATDRSTHFFDVSEIPVKVYREADEWEAAFPFFKWKGKSAVSFEINPEKSWQKIGDPVLHIELRKWADIMVIAPLDANTMAKIAGGLCDNVLAIYNNPTTPDHTTSMVKHSKTCVVRAWDMQRPLVFCPAMNTHMWNHPITRTHVDTLCKMGYINVPPIHKQLACGDTGTGGMAEVTTIVEKVTQILQDQN